MTYSQPKKMPLGAKIMAGFAFVMCLVGGGRLLFLAVDGMREAGESASWPRVDGKVIRSEMTTSTRRDHHGQHRRTNTTFFEASIEYEFEVNGKAYRGTRITTVKDMNAKKSRAQAILNKYPVDRRVTVSYKPDDPSVCVLEPGSWGGALVQLALGAFFVLVPVAISVTIWRLAPKSSTTSSSTPADDQFTAPRFDQTE